MNECDNLKQSTDIEIRSYACFYEFDLMPTYKIRSKPR